MTLSAVIRLLLAGWLAGKRVKLDDVDVTGSNPSLEIEAGNADSLSVK